jgi:hypothetical protein
VLGGAGVRFFFSASLASTRGCFKAENKGTDVMILEIFLLNNFCEKNGSFVQNKAKSGKNLIIILVLRRTPFFPTKLVENRRKL